MFGNIGFPELLIIMAIALLIFGPKKLPEVGRSIGKAVREFRRTSDELRGRIEEEIHASEYKEIKEELKRDIQEITPESHIPEPRGTKEEPKKESSSPQETSPYIATGETEEEPKKESQKDEEGPKVS